MYRQHQTLNGFFCAAIALLLCCAGSVWAQPTAVTYQGKLTDAGNPANGNYDLQFKLFDTPTVATGAQQGGTMVRNPTAASAGVFTVTLDFGASVFSGADRYLEIGVRPAGSASAYTVLAPRNPITSSPYAIQTLNAQFLGGLPASSYLASTASGNVGIGTATPEQTLQVNGVTSLGPPGSVYGYLVNGASPGPYPTLGFNTYGPTYLAGVLGYGSVFQYQNGDGSLTYYTGTLNSPGEPHDFIPRFTILRDGTVGIGTTNPVSSRLNVVDGGSGNAVFGNSVGGAGVVGGSSSGTGVYAGSTSGTGVYGASTSSLGVHGEGGSVGVKGNSSSGRGVVGESGSGSGVYGESAVTASATAAGVFGKGTGAGGVGVIGEGNTNNGVGVYGTSSNPTGFALYGRNTAGGRALYLQGNAGQDLNTGGLVKAMVQVSTVNTIDRCFNSTLSGAAATTVPCGFSILRICSGSFCQTDVDFGFNVGNRFWSATVSNRYYTGPDYNMGINVDAAGVSNTLRVRMFVTNEPSYTDIAVPFSLLVY